MTSPAMLRCLADLETGRHKHDRDMLRSKAAKYRRDIRVLLAWTFPDSRDAVAMGEVYPYRPNITREICHRLYRDLQDAKALPKFFRRRQMRIETLRELFACECEQYRNQRASVNAQASMNGFLNSLAAE